MIFDQGVRSEISRMRWLDPLFPLEIHLNNLDRPSESLSERLHLEHHQLQNIQWHAQLP